ncbi:glycoside hydrolase family 130 protein [Spirochaeta lutea]|uniref:Glycosidase n=1 Tax=Spirochaeta lutea TaxID=1480694 RepID=A0A098QSK2_9SPIO|nr:glycoside hydrolase family 130 protein [Spirochaeta lutea]KGE70810.1 hypothetical protein DC28_15095 [Spirochaeta lutea]
MQSFSRFSENPLLVPGQVVPSQPDMKVEGIFNCGAVQVEGSIVLLCRVAESVSAEQGEVSVPVLSGTASKPGIDTKRFDQKTGHLDFSDSRTISNRATGKVEHLTSLSHFRLARSTDGRSFTLDEKPWIFPQGVSEQWGIEDPRITRIDDRFYISYSSISPDGITVSLISTQDFIGFERHGVILPPSNKDAALFPRKINGRYWMLHRPITGAIGNLNIWAASSENLLDWGNHTLIYRAGESGPWELDRVGVGPPPVWTPRGWLVMYHAADVQSRYVAGLLLLDEENPARVIARGRAPYFVPQGEAEQSGFFSNVVFPCGLVEQEQGLLVYYGAADDKVCGGFASWDSIWEVLT